MKRNYKDTITAMYTIIDDMLIAFNYKDDIRTKFRDAELITAVLAAAMYHGGNIEKACNVLKSCNFMPNMLSMSRFNRRMHRVRGLIEQIFFSLAKIWKKLNSSTTFVIDSFPVASCKNIRIQRSRLFKGEKYRGYNASKREFFYGLKVQVIVNEDNMPMEVTFMPGSFHDSRAYDMMNFNLPKNSKLIGDNAYDDKEVAKLLELQGITLLCDKRSNSINPNPVEVDWLIKLMRKPIETAFSTITSLFPKRIHAVTPQGFTLKILLFIMAYSLDKLIP